MSYHISEDVRLYLAGNEARTIDDPESKPSRLTLGQSEAAKIRRSRTHSANSKLEELRLAFGTLAKKIQGTEKEENDGKDLGASLCLHTAFNGQGGVSKCSDPVITRYRSSSNIGVDRIHLPQAGATEDNKGHQGGTRRQGTSASVFFPLRGKKSEVASKTQAIRCLQSKQKDMKDLMRMKAAAYAAGRDAAEVAARLARQELKLVHAELESEKKSRQAAESALQEVQQRAAEELVERERPAKVVNSVGGLSFGELAAKCQSLEQRVINFKCSLAEARFQADAKASEALEALERAADLGEILEKERVARSAAVDELNKLRQDFRACLRARAKAEEVASAASRALQQSEVQRRSLTQRLEVLRSVNKRLDRKAAAAAAIGSTMEMDERIAAARTRLHNHSASNLIDSGGSGSGDGEDITRGGSTKVAMERAFKTALVDKKWRGKKHDLEAQGEAYRSAAQAAERTMQRVVREKEELVEMNRILNKRLALLCVEELSPTGARDTQITAAPSAVIVCVERPWVCGEDLCSSQSDTKLLCGSHETANEGTGAKAGSENLLRGDFAALSPTDHSTEITRARDAASSPTATIPPMRSNITNQARKYSGDSRSTSSLKVEVIAQTMNASHGHVGDQTISPKCLPRRARSNSFDADERPAFPQTFRVARPHSASEASRFSHHTLHSVHERHDAAILNQLLTDSRRIRADVLSALRSWPWRERAQLNHAACTPVVSLRAPQRNGEDALAVEVTSRTLRESTPTSPVPVDVLRRLCSRSARFAKGERESKNIKSSVGEGVRYTPTPRREESDASDTARVEPALDSAKSTPAVEDELLPPGVTAALAQQGDADVVDF